jgi:hypothetical protein
MEQYVFYGTVLPERAQLSLQCELEFSHVGSGVPGRARLSIILNQVVVWIDSDYAWDVFDLGNVVKNIVRNQLAMVSFVKGFAYDFELTRVVNPERSIDYVYGVDIPVLVERGKDVDLNAAVQFLREHATGATGVYVHRCLADLVSSMRNADDTGFYCYRAIESLRHHCAAVHQLTESDKSKQWSKFREVSGADEQTLREIKDAADPLRHGQPTGASSEDRARLFTMTWDVVDGYLRGTT